MGSFGLSTAFSPLPPNPSRDAPSLLRMALAPAFFLLVAAQLQIGIPMAEVDDAGEVTVSLQVVNKSPASVDTALLDAFLVDTNGTRIQAAPTRYWIPPRMRRSVSFAFQGVDADRRDFSIELLGLPQGPAVAQVYFYEDEVDHPVALIDPTAPCPHRSSARPRGDTGPLAELLVQLAIGLLSR